VLTIIADAQSVFGVKQVDFQIDGVSIGIKNSSPYSINYNANNLSSGDHQISAVVLDNSGLSSKNTITVSILKDTTPPGYVSNVSIVSIVQGATITWKNPTDTDLSKVRFYLSTSAGSLGNKYANEAVVSSGTTSSFSLSGLITGTHYYITIRPVDNSNNENQSVTQYSVVPL
jgi:hypothetical protein